jgi:hypothetical protein
MAKVIVERPRKGGGVRRPKTRLITPANNRPPLRVEKPTGIA